MANITITQELVKFLFDYKDGFLYWKIRPYRSHVNIYIPAGCISIGKDSNRRIVTINKKGYLNSRLIFLYHNGYLSEEVDHINRNTLDDRIENLRAATFSQNCANRVFKKTSSSRYKGVYLVDGKYWVSSIKVNGVFVYLGCFKTDNDAAIAYNREAVRYHGEFAFLNIIKL